MGSLHLHDNFLQQTSIVAYRDASIKSQVNAKAKSTTIIKRIARERTCTALDAAIELVA